MKVIVAGDYSPCARMAKQIEERRFNEVFPEKLKNIIKSVDYSFVNLECPIAENAYKPIPKCGPSLKWAGWVG